MRRSQPAGRSPRGVKFRTLAAFMAALLICGGGLTPGGVSLRASTAIKGREAAAAALEKAQWLLCRAMPVGAIKDRYGRSAELAAAYSRLCGSFSEDFLEVLETADEDG
jgi:hypothetical protein